ncbi:MAG: hypothetical protein LBJ86_01115 [Spirochaetaceae bacterium]|nr:hypothetical protein [Spirochaetaceae bacterium]
MNGAGVGSVTLEGLSGNDVFLVKVNASDSGKNASIATSGFTAGEHVRNVPAGVITIDGKTLTRYERQWQGPYPPAGPLAVSRSMASVYTEAKTVGDKNDFYVDISPDSEIFTGKKATLKVIGKHCKVWVIDEYFDDTSPADGTDGKVNLSQLKELADKFDAIYPLETALLGYEYGGGPGGDGGADGDPSIQILVFNIDGDYIDSSPNGFTLGYFNPYDEYQKTAGNQYSNEAEIFYLDSEALDRMQDTIYSTLIHEFNHMINFNVKVIQPNSQGIEVWYTEMLSMLAEDVIGPLAGIPYEPGKANGNVITDRIHRNWLQTYFGTSVMSWNNSLNDYAANYAFGAYLVRNFGGPQLLSDIAKSASSGGASLDESLRKINGQRIDTKYALSRFGEALVYSGSQIPATALSFDKTVSATIAGNLYTFPRFDIWKMTYSSGGNNYAGPKIFLYEQESNSIPPYAVQLFSRQDWLGASGQLTIQMKNGNSAIDYYIMVR